jgi:hypothetical protein
MKVVSDVVSINSGVDVSLIEYEVAYKAGSHAKSIVVVVGLLTVNPVTAFGTGGSVLIGSDVVDGPLPITFEGVIVNVYSVSGTKSVNVKVVSDVVCIISGVDVSIIEYEVAYKAGSHAKSIVVVVGLLAVNPVTAFGTEGGIKF